MSQCTGCLNAIPSAGESLLAKKNCCWLQNKIQQGRSTLSDCQFVFESWENHGYGETMRRESESERVRDRTKVRLIEVRWRERYGFAQLARAVFFPPTELNWCEKWKPLSSQGRNRLIYKTSLVNTAWLKGIVVEYVRVYNSLFCDNIMW